MNQKVKKAVIPAAGLGTRFLPVTKSIPKEMIPIIDRPMLHYIVEEAVNSGIQDVVLISARNKESIEKYFVYNYELEDRLVKSGKEDVARDIKKIADSCNIIVVYQKEPLGLGHAIGCAKSVVGQDPFAILLGDDLIDTPYPMLPCTRQLMNIYDQHHQSVVGVMEVAAEDVIKYGIVGGQPLQGVPKTMTVTDLIEKPKKEQAPSRFAIPGRYVLDAEIFKCIENTRPGANGEIQLTDALLMLARSKGLLAHEFTGDRYDTGDRLGYLDATLTFGLRRPELKEGLIALMKKHLKSLGVAFGAGLIWLMSGQIHLPEARAYVLPANYIMSQEVKPKSKLKKIELTGEITDLRTQKKWEEILQVDFESNKVHVSLFTSAGQKVSHKVTSVEELSPLGLAWLGVGLDPRFSHVMAYLDRLQVQLAEKDQPRMNRINDRPVYEWGDPAQIQIEKDEFWFAGYKSADQNALQVEQFFAATGAGMIPKVVRIKKAAVIGPSDLFLYELKKERVNNFTMTKKDHEAQGSDEGGSFGEWLSLVR